LACRARRTGQAFPRQSPARRCRLGPGFFDDLVIPIGDLRRDTIPRTDTSFEKLAKLPPSFDHTSGHGTMTAGNSSPLTDGAASLWVASQAGVAKLPGNVYKARLVDWEITSIDLRTEGLLRPQRSRSPPTSALWVDLR